tara:strand:- start:578 stop:997 length:420 start_codon:yes stop_codon:yes gene_type:complete
MNCKYFDREESLNKREENLLNYLKDVATFFVGFWHSKKEARKSARAVANNGLDQIAGATDRNDMFAMRQYLKESMTAYLSLAFGEDFIELLVSEVDTLFSLMGEKSYEEFIADHSNILLINTIENSILVRGTKLNLINK